MEQGLRAKCGDICDEEQGRYGGEVNHVKGSDTV
jgi:hypothetical protein